MLDTTTNKRTRRVEALARGLDVLDLFLQAKEALSVPEIAERLELPRSSAYELVLTLVERGCLEPWNGHPHRYTPGLHLFELGNAYAAKLDLAREGQVVAQKLSDLCNETVHVAVLDGTEIIYLTKVEGNHPVRMVSEVGRRIRAHCTGVGKAALSGLSKQEIAERYSNPDSLLGVTPNSVTSIERLQQELEEIRVGGLAFDDGESSVGVRCVAAPVRDHHDKVVAGLSIAVPIIRMDDDRQRELGELVRWGAEELSSRLGFRSATTEPRPTEVVAS